MRYDYERFFWYVITNITDKFAQKVKKVSAYELIHGTVADAMAKLDTYAQLLKAQGHYNTIRVTKDEYAKAIRWAFDEKKGKHEEEHERFWAGRNWDGVYRPVIIAQ